jgi:hypothetical protein
MITCLTGAAILGSVIDGFLGAGLGAVAGILLGIWTTATEVPEISPEQKIKDERWFATGCYMISGSCGAAMIGSLLGMPGAIAGAFIGAFLGLWTGISGRSSSPKQNR